MKPECECFKRRSPGVLDNDGEVKTCLVAATITTTFGDMMGACGVCPAAYEYVMVTCIVMLMKSVAAQDSRGNVEREDAVFQAMLPWLTERVKARGDEMHREAVIMEAGGRN